MKFSILFLYSVVFLGKPGQSQLVGQQDSVLPKLVASVKDDGMTMESSSGRRAFEPTPVCMSLGETANACLDRKPGCPSCLANLEPADASCEAAKNFFCLGAGGCQECAGCELVTEAYFRCELPFINSSCPRLDCNFGIVPCFGELPIIGPIFNLLFGWLVNIFN